MRLPALTQEGKILSDTESLTNLVKNTVKIEEQDRQRQAQRRREATKQRHRDDVSNLSGLAGGRSRGESKNNNGGR